MTLRTRLLLTILVTAALVTPALLWLAARQERRAVEESVRSYALSMMNDWGRAECLRRPAQFAGGAAYLKTMGFDIEKLATRPKLMNPTRIISPREMWTNDDVWAYRSSFQSDNKHAPPFPARLRDALERGADIASEPFEVKGDPRDHISVAIRTEWPDDPCAILLVSHSAPRRPEAASNRMWLAIAQSGVLLLAVLLACLPIVKRIRALTAAVKTSATSQYAVPVPEEGRDEINGLARAFNEAGAEVHAHLAALEQREATLRDFIANTTHDVMLPLTVLQGHLAEIRRQTEDRWPVDPQLVASCHREADYLTSIIRNLAAVAKLEGADYQTRSDSVSLNQLVDRVVSRYRSIAKVEKIGLDFSVPGEELEAIGDMTLLEQALGNVIHNAIRYNRTEGHVAVVLEHVPGERFSLKVIDDGPGIPDADLARLAERRFRGDAARARNPAGLGLGLHIAREVAARHGFSLEFRRSEYGGLEVELSGELKACRVA